MLSQLSRRLVNTWKVVTEAFISAVEPSKDGPLPFTTDAESCLGIQRIHANSSNSTNVCCSCKNMSLCVLLAAYASDIEDQVPYMLAESSQQWEWNCCSQDCLRLKGVDIQDSGIFILVRKRLHYHMLLHTQPWSCNTIAVWSLDGLCVRECEIESSGVARMDLVVSRRLLYPGFNFFIWSFLLLSSKLITDTWY